MNYSHNIPANAKLSYAEKSIDILITEFSYSWMLSSSGSAQTRTYNVMYPQFFRQNDPIMKIAFINSEHQSRFVEWVKAWHTYVSQQRGSFEPLRLVGDGSIGEEFKYAILIKDVQYNNSVGNNAPKVSVSLTIIDDQWNESYSQSSSYITGSEVPEISKDTGSEFIESIFRGQ